MAENRAICDDSRGISKFEAQVWKQRAATRDGGDKSKLLSFLTSGNDAHAFVDILIRLTRGSSSILQGDDPSDEAGVLEP